MWTITGFFSNLFKVFFPPSCLGCKSKNVSICRTCLQKVSRAVEAPYIYMTSIYSYKDQLIRNSIRKIKYYHRKDLIDPLTDELAKEILNEANGYRLMANDWTLVPIPMSRFRKYMRGYNQAELIATSLGEKCNIHVDHSVLKRSRSPISQVHTRTRSERLKNQNNSFKVCKDIKGRNFILVDDVTTTGATISEARKQLLKTGAREVLAVTIAH
ncbi:MAG: amidophosphoribosyltransferase [Candidatus Nomurabacteria bacterium]|nr:amidophosphoribosyltransferase [Candidatus Nomurabacteria bacterium]